MSLKNTALYILKLSFLQFFWEKIHRLSLIGMNYWGGNDLFSSGEINVIQYVYKELLSRKSKQNTLQVFDVGANVGKYCRFLIDLAPQSKQLHIHCFEPSKKTFEKLSSVSTSHSNIKIYHNNFGLSDTSEEKELYSSSETATIASLYNTRDKASIFKEEYKEIIELKTIDEYCVTNSITHIDFLKIDVEGHEISTLKGAKKMLETSAIHYIQFEFGECNIASKTYMKDFFDILPQYNIYRILPNSIRKIKHYSEDIEIFATSNFLAVLK